MLKSLPDYVGTPYPIITFSTSKSLSFYPSRTPELCFGLLTAVGRFSNPIRAAPFTIPCSNNSLKVDSFRFTEAEAPPMHHYPRASDYSPSCPFFVVGTPAINNFSSSLSTMFVFFLHVVLLLNSMLVFSVVLLRSISKLSIVAYFLSFFPHIQTRIFFFKPLTFLIHTIGWHIPATEVLNSMRSTKRI